MAEVALFFRIDDEPKFGVTICQHDQLGAAVREALFGKGDITTDDQTEVIETCADLVASGRVNFEDGWLELRTGMADAIAFVVERCKEAHAEAVWADQRRGDEYVRANAAVLRYGQLRQALLEALGDKAAVVQAVASA